MILKVIGLAAIYIGLIYLLQEIFGTKDPVVYASVFWVFGFIFGAVVD